MKTFKEHLDETVYRTQHIRAPQVMAGFHKLNLKDAGHEIIKHEVSTTGDHVIIHKSPLGRVRVSTIHPGPIDGKYRTVILNRPATSEEQRVHCN